jgi:hypothetical protein
MDRRTATGKALPHFQIADKTRLLAPLDIPDDPSCLGIWLPRLSEGVGFHALSYHITRPAESTTQAPPVLVQGTGFQWPFTALE